MRAQHAIALFPLLVLPGLSSCGRGMSVVSVNELPIIADAPEAFDPPSLTAAITYDNPNSQLGWGSFDLSAYPELHEIRVGLMMGTPVSATRWNRCPALDLRIDGRPFRLPARYTGVPMAGGVYDAITVELTIEHVRAMAGAQDVTADLCGDVATLSEERLRTLESFVRRFEEMATHDGPSPPSPPPEFDPMVGPDIEPRDPPLPA